MATQTALRIPFEIQTRDSQYTGTIVGGRLEAYSVYEVRLDTGDIFNIEAIPMSNRFHWFSLHKPEIASLVGKQVQYFFKNYLS
jgi:hypothetical protein